MHRSCAVVSLLTLATVVAAQRGGGSHGDSLADAWQMALTQAKTHKAPILAFVLPAADAVVNPERVQATWERERAVGMRRTYREPQPTRMTAREALLRQIQLLRVTRHGPATGVRGGMAVQATRGTALFALTIPVVASAASCSAEPGETVVLLGPDGKRLRGFTSDLLAAEQFLDDVGAVVFEPKVLAARAANIPAGLARAVAALPKPGPDPGGGLQDVQLWQRLVAEFPAAAPALVQWSEGDLAMHHLLWLLEDSRQPLGTERVHSREDSCVACGMGFTPPSLLGALKLIGP